jgi:hypothetical protein
MTSVCAFKLTILKKAIAKFRKSERIVGPKGTVAIQELLAAHGDSGTASRVAKPCYGNAGRKCANKTIPPSDK